MKHWDAFKAGEAAYVDTEGDLRAAIDAACTIAYAEGRKDEALKCSPVVLSVGELIGTADWRVGGDLSHESPPRAFNSTAVSIVKTRKLARLRDAWSDYVIGA